jgi:hypothetical protein
MPQMIGDVVNMSESWLVRSVSVFGGAKLMSKSDIGVEIECLGGP